MKKEDWKYLVKELFLYYRQDYITKFVKISKVSLYRWLKGEAYPRFIETKMRLLKLARKIDNKNSLIRKSKIKERKLIKLSKKPKLSIKNKKITINTIPLIFEEIKEREKKSANNWYIKDIDKNYITIKYFGNYNERFIKLPLKIKFDEELAKIIGFWFGDGTTNKPSYVLHRSYITFVNEDISVLKYLKRFLFNLKQNNDSEIEIIKGKLVNKKRLNKFIRDIKKLKIRFYVREHGNWSSIGACLHVKNAPLSYIFEFIKDNIDFLLENSPEKIKSAFLGGYFTAEGAVSKINQWFVFNETKDDRQKLILKILNEKRFGSSEFRPYIIQEQIKIAYRSEIRKHDFELFRKLILPYIFSEGKVKATYEMLRGKNLRNIDLIYLFYIFLHKDCTTKDISVNFQKDTDYLNRVYRNLEKMKLVKRKRKCITEFFLFNLTKKGKKLILKDSEKIKEFLLEIKRLHTVNRGYKGTFYIKNPAIKEMIEFFNL